MNKILLVCSILVWTAASFAQTASKAPDTAKPGATEVLEAARKAKGSFDTLKGVKDLTISGSISVSIQGQPMELAVTTYAAPPDRLRQDILIPAMSVTVTQMVNGSSGWIDSPQGAGEMPEVMVETMRRGNAREWFINFLVAPQGKQYEVTLQPETTIDAKPVDVLSVKMGEDSFTVFLDKQTHLAVKSAYKTINQQMEPVSGESRYEDYKDVAGIKLSHRSTTFQNGEKSAEIRLSEIKLNTGIDEAKFKK